MSSPGSKKSNVVQKQRMHNGQKVIPCLYNGRALGHGKYFAAMIGSELQVDEDGKPFYYREFGQLV